MPFIYGFGHSYLLGWGGFMVLVGHPLLLGHLLAQGHPKQLGQGQPSLGNVPAELQITLGGQQVMGLERGYGRLRKLSGFSSLKYKVL